MAEDWLADVRKYVADADENVVKAIVRHCGIALQNRDSSMVSFSDKKETDRVRENFLKKKLGLTDSDDVLDNAIAAIGNLMREDRTKNRVTVYYLLARHFGLLNVFGGIGGTGGAAGVAGAAGAAGLAAAASGAFSGESRDETDKIPEDYPDAAVGAGAAGTTGGAAAVPIAAMSAPLPDPAESGGPSYAASSYGDDDAASGGGLGWLKWLLLAAVLALLLFVLLRSCSGDRAVPTEQRASAEATAGQSADAAPDKSGAVAKAGAAAGDNASAAAATPAVIPQGAGVTQGEIGGRPKLTVYFDSGKSAVTNDLSAAAGKLKDYMAKNPDARIAVSGYNDPSGNAAANAALSKKRAQEVAKALEKIGISAKSINLEKPLSATDASGNAAEARRVEVVVKP